MQDRSQLYEQLGKFYLGREYDVPRKVLEQETLLYDSKDLVTHAVCVGMTGSGKTGLGVTLLEEAAIDGIPALVVDPKGDLTNLLLTFPQLRSEDFQPWLHAADAAREGISLQDLAARKAETWKEGLSDWDQSPDRIGRLAASCEFNIYTPGSEAGMPVSILSSFASPPPEVRADGDLLRDRISTTATSLLTLLGVDADPIRSREHILITTILDHCWNEGLGMDLGTLIQMVQTPPVKRVGVMDLESFYPSKERFELAMTMNNLLAAPSFAAWMTGEPLDVDQLLYTPQGKPRVSIFYIAHLSDSERMFFLSLLLNQTLGWMRTRSGTTSLRALLYIDEIFGYMPPVAEPPTKKPLLTLLKQARAYGLGIVLATQNPVDLDYKGLSNTGTWFLGRLQTEQDKQRVLDGLEGASNESGSRFDRDSISEILSDVGQRVFLMHNVHQPLPLTFQTRWALSYLAGPLTRTQIKRLMRPKKAEAAHPPAATASLPSIEPPRPAPAEAQRPVLPSTISQVFLPVRRVHMGVELVYEPRLLAICKIHFVDTRKGLAADEELILSASPEVDALGVEWDRAVPLDLSPDELLSAPPLPGRFAELAANASQPKNYAAWKKKLTDHLYRSRRFPLLKCTDLKEFSRPGETEREFRIRISDEIREHRDQAVEKLREKYSAKIDSLEERLRKAELRLQREAQEAEGAKMQSAISVGATILSALVGRRKLSSTTVGRAATAARGVGRASKQADDVRRAQADVESYEEKIEELQDELEREVEDLTYLYHADSVELEELLLKPRKSDVDVRHLALAWTPFGIDAAGAKTPLF